MLLYNPSHTLPILFVSKIFSTSLYYSTFFFVKNKRRKKQLTKLDKENKRKQSLSHNMTSVKDLPD
jgi:hypothetical protein